MTRQLSIHPKIEIILKQIILKDLHNKGRSNFDKSHTLKVVHWTKFLLSKPLSNKLTTTSNKTINNSPLLNPKVLITAAYAHDWGYSQLFANKQASSNYKKIQEQKPLHMWQGAIKIERLLYQRLSSHFTGPEITRIAHLVWFHDKLKYLKDEDEILLMEADTLGGLDNGQITPTFSKIDNKKYLKEVEIKRLPLFIHEEAKKIAKKLFEARKKL